jgi:hypothetical protein
MMPIKAGTHIRLRYLHELNWAKVCEEAAATCLSHAEVHRLRAQEHRAAAARWAQGTDLETAAPAPEPVHE